MKTNISESLGDILRNSLRLDPLTLDPQQILIEISGWDSLRLMKVLMAVEKKFGVEFVASDLLPIRTWGDLINLIDAKISKPH